MSVETIISRLVTIEEAIEGVARAFDNAPESLASGDLPAVINTISEGEFSTAAASYVQVVHTITIYLFVTPRTDLTRDEALVRPFIERFQDAFAAAVKLNDLAGVAHADLISYRYGALTFADHTYAGVEFTLQVTEKRATNVES